MSMQLTQTTNESKHIRVQSIMPDNTLFIVIPKVIANNLSIKKQDYVRVSRKNNKIIVEKIEE
jgi:hypothetical protein